MAAAGNLLDDQRERRAVFEHTRGLEHQQPFAERGGIGVNGGDFPLREFFLQLLHGHGGRMRRAADAAGHADVEHIVALRERTLKVFRHQGGIDH